MELDRRLDWLLTWRKSWHVDWEYSGLTVECSASNGLVSLKTRRASTTECSQSILLWWHWLEKIASGLVTPVGLTSDKTEAMSLEFEVSLTRQVKWLFWSCTLAASLCTLRDDRSASKYWPRVKFNPRMVQKRWVQLKATATLLLEKTNNVMSIHTEYNILNYSWMKIYYLLWKRKFTKIKAEFNSCWILLILVHFWNFKTSRSKLSLI